MPQKKGYTFILRNPSFLYICRTLNRPSNPGFKIILRIKIDVSRRWPAAPMPKLASPPRLHDWR